MEIEFVACFEATSHGVWLKSFIFGLRIVDSIARSLRIFCNNSTAIFLTKNNRSSSRSKCINIKFLAMRERVNENKVVIQYVSTEFMIVDPLTKGMPPSSYKGHVDRMGRSHHVISVQILVVMKFLFSMLFLYFGAHFQFENNICVGPRINIRFIHQVMG